jgi:hypothetical protein
MGKPVPKPEKENVRILSNGAIYDMDRKRIVALRPELATKPTQITSETASDFHALAQEKKRNALRRAANAVAEQGGGVDGRELWGDMAYVEAIGEAMTMKALTVNDPKAVDAARFIFKETGISDEHTEKPGNTTNILVVDADVRRALELLKNMQDAQLHE